jgi:predicted O-methyltransferase YrrM
VSPSRRLSTAAVLRRARFRIGTAVEMDQAGRRLSRLRANVRSNAELIDIALNFRFKNTFIRPLQLVPEITRLLEVVQALRPVRVLEIGTASGGTLFLFASVAAPTAQLVSVDHEPYRDHPCNPTRQRLYRRLVCSAQRLEVIQGDSHDASTASMIQQTFGAPLDFIFVDGDHSYEGVKRDAELYLPLLRHGGVAAFHDIVPDNPRNATGVADWWREFSASHEVEEIVEDWNQAGYGIGIWRAPS